MRKLLAALSLAFLAYFAMTTAPPPETPVVRILSPVDLDNQWSAMQHAEKLLKAVKQAHSVFTKVGCHRDYSALVGQYAVLEGVNARVAAALVYVESSCNPKADDHLGSHGLTQVNIRTWRGHTVKELEDPETNIRTGLHILAGYIHRYGVKEGLHHYNGLGNPSDEYALRVLAAAGGSFGSKT